MVAESYSLRVVVCTGIYPPDVGGPATHAHDLREELTARGHSVRVLTLSDSETDPRVECATVRRSLPWPLRFLAIVRWLVHNRRRYDVIYATGLHGPAVLGARLSRRPVVVKVVGDPAWERGRRLGLTAAKFDAFQRQGGGSMRMLLMRWFRSRWSCSTTAVTVPSEFLREVVLRWGVAADKVVTIPNGVRVPVGPPPSVDRDGSLRLVFVGRLIRHKGLDLILDAISQIPEVELKIIGEGPQSEDVTSLRDRLGLRDRVEVVGRLDHDAVLDQLRAGDALVLASEYEGLPHVAVEALACGTPVIAPPVGGVHELVSSGENGLLYEPLTAESMRRSICRLAEDRSLLRRLSDQALEARRICGSSAARSESSRCSSTQARSGRPW